MTMPQLSLNGKPFWLSAYPNEGTLDYFGFRFYRQPLRKYLVRGAAANDFKNAKTLLYYAAITYGYRKENSIAIDSDLTDIEHEKWEHWYRAANYLYIVNRYSKYEEVPDRGFTGANEESQIYFKIFYEQSTGQYNIRDSYYRIYPAQRKLGYLAQFWRPPLDYFRCVIDTERCIPGEYAQDCYELLSSYENWNVFIKILSSGIVEREELSAIQDIIESKQLNGKEKKLAKIIIFDENDITQGENNEYKKSYTLLHNLNIYGCENFIPKDKNDYAMVFTYAHLNNLRIDENDLGWRILISSLAFEIGINRLYTILGRFEAEGIINTSTINRELSLLVNKWMSDNNFTGDLAQVEDSWKIKYINNINSFNSLFRRMLKGEDLTCCFDGILQGYILSKVQVSAKEKLSDAYLAMTDRYHYFAPQPFFLEKKIDSHIQFTDFILKIAKWIIDEQFDFSLERMNYGQKAKFILSRSEFDDQYLFQIDNRTFHENTGIIDMIDACLSLWKTAGMLEEN